MRMLADIECYEANFLPIVLMLQKSGAFQI